MKKARAENVTLKRERHGLLKVLSSILEKSVRRDSRAELSSDVVTIPNQKIGEGTFDVVSIGHVKTLDSFCVVKEGKLSHHFNAIFEARSLQSLAGCDYFPYVFAAFDGNLVMELITCENNKMVTVSSIKKENKLTSTDWNDICFCLASAAKYMYLQKLLLNHLQSNNVLLKLRNNVWTPKLADMGKVTLKSNPEIYKLSNSQRDRYNKI